MTSRNPRDRDAPLPPTTGTGATVTRLPGTARRADGAQPGRSANRRRTPKPAPGRGRVPVPDGFPGPGELAPLARRMLADAVRIARWAGELEAVDKRGELLPDDARAAGRALAMTVGAAAKAWGRP